MLAKQGVEDTDHWRVVASHRDSGGSGVEKSCGSWAQSDEERQAVAGGNPVGPQSRGSSIAVRKGMDSGPFAVGDGCDPQRSVQLYGRRRSRSNRDHGVQRGECGPHPGLKREERPGNFRGRDSGRATDLHLIADEFREGGVGVADLTGVVGGRKGDTGESAPMPVLRHRNRWRQAGVRIAFDLEGDRSKVGLKQLAGARWIRVPGKGHGLIASAGLEGRRNTKGILVADDHPRTNRVLERNLRAGECGSLGLRIAAV